MCNDGKERMCVIRKKFRGRHKRGNIVQPDVKVLVGLRDWEVTGQGKKEKCDLLEVYKHEQHSDLMNAPGIKWALLRTMNDDKADKMAEETFEFANDDGDAGFDFDDDGFNIPQSNSIITSNSSGEINIDDI